MRRVHRGAFAAPALSSALEELPDSRDRSLLTDLVYGTLRHEILLDACLAGRLPAPERLPAEVLDCLRIGAYELLVRRTPPHAAVDEWVNEVKRRSRKLAGLSNAVLRRVELPRELPESVRRSLPDWLSERLNLLLGEQADSAATGMLEPEPLWLSAMKAEAAAALEDEGCEVTAGPVEGSLAVRAPVPLGHLRAFKAGLVQPQNPASRLPVTALGSVAGKRVLDLASGNGIKSAQLAAAGAEVVAIEKHAGKAQRAEANLRRLGLRVEQLVADLRDPPDLDPAPQVLLDAPCSGTGTLRGNPEIKLRLREQDLDELTRLQASLLDSAASLTAAGGTLVYSVCALTPEEGPQQAQAFLNRNRNFEPDPWQPPANVAGVSVDPSLGITVVPKGGLDGFFIFRARRH